MPHDDDQRRDPRDRLPDFEAVYAGAPPWDIGRPQPALVELAERGAVRGRVLDAGCGTGEHALMAARIGLPATGIDTAPAAIAGAREKARQRALDARFLVWDAQRRVTRAEIEQGFADGWEVDAIDPATIAITLDPRGVMAWRAKVTRR